MKDQECVAFLQWCLPRLHLRWPGFRRVRSQVCKRLRRRLVELQLGGLDAYRLYLERHEEEWRHLDTLCRITISRFYRDRSVFEALATQVLPELAEQARAAGRRTLRCWSCGCASGEEPYTLLLLWRLELQQCFPDLSLELLASDADEHMLDRARRGVYQEGSLRELPAAWRAAALETQDDVSYRARDSLIAGITWSCHDVRHAMPAGPFDLVLCRNLVFTYFDTELQQRIATRLATLLHPNGVLVLGSHERLPEGDTSFEQRCPNLPIHHRH